MKILAVDEDAVVPEYQMLWKEIARLGSDVVLVVPSRWGKYVAGDSDKSSLFEFIRTPVVFHGKSHRACYPRLASLVRRFTPEILYVNAEPESVLSWQAARLKRSHPRMRLVFMSWRNIDYPDGEFPYKLPFLYAHAEKQTILHADLCVCRNEPAKRILARKGFTKTCVIRPGVDTALFKAGEHSRHSPFTIGFAGRLVLEKGLDLLFEASAKLKFDHSIVVAGMGPEKDVWVRTAERYGVAERVEWKGNIPYRSMPEFLRGLDVLVLSSRTMRYWKEQFGRVLIESLACGIPVIGSESGEIPSVIADAGLIFKEGSVEGLAMGLERLHGDPALVSHLRDAGLIRVRQEFDLRTCAVRFHEAFRSLHS